MNVNSDTHPQTGNSRAFIVCDRRDDMGFIGLDPCDLKQWQLSRSQLADFLVRSLSLTPSGVSVDAPAIALGWTTSKHGRRHVCLQFEGTPQLSIDNGTIPLDQLVFWNGTAIAVDHESFRLIADQRPQAARHVRSNVRREARKLDTLDRHQRWQKEYRRLKQEKPWWSDEAIAAFIAESDPGPKRKTWNHPTLHEAVTKLCAKFFRAKCEATNVLNLLGLLDRRRDHSPLSQQVVRQLNRLKLSTLLRV